VKGNDLTCDKDGNCNEFQVRSAVQAMLLCQSYGQECQGFVFAFQSGRLFLKTNLDVEPIHDPFLEFYVRAEFREKLNLIENTCAIPIEDFQDSSQFKCTMPILDPFNANIMKHMDKTKTVIVCQGQGERFTEYRDGALSLQRTGVFDVVWLYFCVSFTKRHLFPEVSQGRRPQGRDRGDESLRLIVGLVQGHDKKQSSILLFYKSSRVKVFKLGRDITDKTKN
jgi:hypothetical protein